ncbi:MAG: MazG family protein [Thermodesulfobacteriota bacterium]
MSQANEGAGAKLEELIRIVARLRGPEGCPWDQRQDDESMKGHLIEETYELAEALDRQDPGHVCEELGDVLFHIVFLSQLYAERGAFAMPAVAAGIIAKMIRRHPHVFGSERLADEAAQRAAWQRLKAAEGRADRLASIPRTLPALRRAQKILSRATADGLPLPDLTGTLASLAAPPPEATPADDARQLADALLALVERARRAGLNAEEILARRLEALIVELGTGGDGAVVPATD